MKTFLNIRTEELSTIVKELNVLLANYHVHYQKMRNFHWNVYGEQFFELHDQFEQQYDTAKEQIDEVAERILTLKHRPVSNFSDYLYMSSIEEEQKALRPRDMIEATAKDFEKLIAQMNKTISAAEEAGDEGTADLITGFLRDKEKSHWMF